MNRCIYILNVRNEAINEGVHLYPHILNFLSPLFQVALMIGVFIDGRVVCIFEAAFHNSGYLRILPYVH